MSKFGAAQFCHFQTFRGNNFCRSYCLLDTVFSTRICWLLTDYASYLHIC